jgi:hypothetical protein
MNYESINDIYDGNAKVRGKLKALLATLSPEQLSSLPDGEKWTIAQIVEHIAMVDEGTMRICNKLLNKAKDVGRAADGAITISDNFRTKGAEIAAIKVEAPSFVQPSGERTIDDSIAKLDATTEQLEQLRALFESVDGTEFKFPHPFFGEISAQEWLALKGGHEMRHIKQIERLVEMINK